MNVELFWGLGSSKTQKVGGSNPPSATKTVWKDRQNQGIAEAGLALYTLQRQPGKTGNRTVGKSGIPLALGARSCGFKSRQSDKYIA